MKCEVHPISFYGKTECFILSMVNDLLFKENGIIAHEKIQNTFQYNNVVFK